MILVLEIAMLIGGVVALVTGKLKLGQKAITEGVAARVAGAVFLLPLPLAFTIGVVVGMTQAAQGQPVDGGFNLTLVLMEAGVVVGCLVVGLVIAFVWGGSAPPKKRRQRRDEVYDAEDAEGAEAPRDRRVRPDRPRAPGEPDERVRRKSESEDY